MPCKHTASEQVINCFLSLVAVRILNWMVKEVPHGKERWSTRGAVGGAARVSTLLGTCGRRKVLVSGGKRGRGYGWRRCMCMVAPPGWTMEDGRGRGDDNSGEEGRLELNNGRKRCLKLKQRRGCATKLHNDLSGRDPNRSASEGRVALSGARFWCKYY